MKFYNERAKKCYPGLTFTMAGFELRDSKFLTPIKQVVAFTESGEAYYMPATFCRFVSTHGVDLDALIGVSFEIVERETVNGRTGLFVEGRN